MGYELSINIPDRVEFILFHRQDNSGKITDPLESTFCSIYIYTSITFTVVIPCILPDINTQIDFGIRRQKLDLKAHIKLHTMDR